MSFHRGASRRHGGSLRRLWRSREQMRAERTETHAQYRSTLRRERRIRDGHILSLSALTPGAVLSAEVTFDDGLGQKVRPVVVVQATRSTVLVVPCTSKATLPDLRLEDTSIAGLW